MHLPFKKMAARILLGSALVAGSGLILLSSEDIPVFSPQDKAYYADAETLNYIRPGLKAQILGVTIADDGTVKARFKLTDPKNIPLDRLGNDTAGPISARFMIAYIRKDVGKYWAYNVRLVSSTLPGNSGKANQATFDTATDANFQNVNPGEYIYTFTTKLPAGYDKTATHTVALFATRDLSEFNIESNADAASVLYTFVPDGSQLKQTRDVIRDSSCNKCHGNGATAGDVLTAHGERRGIGFCIMCHTDQSTDPDTMNSVDFVQMIHKLHMGNQLPSVVAGGKYQIIGYRNTVVDFSTVGFPSEIRQCTVCHEQTTNAAQAQNYMTAVSRWNCGSCHDDVDFASGKNHMDMPQTNDSQCTRCHHPTGDEFDPSVAGAHVVGTQSAMLKGVNFSIQSVTNGAAGKSPTVIFTVKDDKGNIIPANKMSRLSLVLAGPTSDYATYVSETATSATANSDGSNTYTFKATIPAGAKGSYAVGIEGYMSATLLPGTEKEQKGVRDAGNNVVQYFSVDGSAVQPRRTVVAKAKCDGCHTSLSLHGGNRNQIEQCVLCHNPNQTDAPVRPAAQKPDQTVNFAYMIHRIHTGEASDREYTIYGNGSSVHDFTEVRYPADRRNCSMCHVNGSENPPLADGLLQVTTPRGVLNPMGATTGACTGCHTETYVASHALSNTTTLLGEACAACHSTTSDFSVSKVHAR